MTGHVGAEHLGRELRGGHRLHQALRRRLGERLATGARRRAPASSHCCACCTLSSDDLVAHRVLAVDHREPGSTSSLGQLAGAGRRDHRVVGAVLEQHGHARAAPSRSTPSEPGRHERAHRQHARGSGALVAGRAPSASASPPPWENPPTTASSRSKPCSAHAASSRSSTAASAVGEGLGACRRDRSATCRTTRSRAAPRRGPRGSTVAKLTLGVEVGEQATEVALVGAVPVHEQQDGARRCCR